MPIYKFFANKLITWFENTVLGTHLSEFHSGYRAYSCHALKKIPFHLCADNYHFDTDILIQYKVGDLRIDETTIPTHYGKESQSPSPWQLIVYVWNIFLSMMEYLLHKSGHRIVKKFDFSPVPRETQTVAR